MELIGIEMRINAIIALVILYIFTVALVFHTILGTPPDWLYTFCFWGAISMTLFIGGMYNITSGVYIGIVFAFMIGGTSIDKIALMNTMCDMGFGTTEKDAQACASAKRAKEHQEALEVVKEEVVVIKSIIEKRKAAITNKDDLAHETFMYSAIANDLAEYRYTDYKDLTVEEAFEKAEKMVRKEIDLEIHNKVRADILDNKHTEYKGLSFQDAYDKSYAKFKAEYK